MEYIAYLMIGFGIGLMMTLTMRKNGGQLQNAKDELEAKKAWIKMVSEQKTKKSNWPSDWPQTRS